MVKIVKIMVMLVVSLGLVVWTDLSYAQKKRPTREKEPEKKPSATIWYLFHSGFAIKTEKHFLIFDYVMDIPAYEDKKGLAAGVIDPTEIKDENVLVFVSHEHPDHFNPIISSWQETVNKIKYIVSTTVTQSSQPFKEEVNRNLVEVNPNQTLTIGEVTISTIRATDSGVGFLVKVDNIVIFHAGDHALWSKALEEPFQKEINKLKDSQVDIALLPISGGGMPNKNAFDGALWVVKELSPKVVIPMHWAGADNLSDAEAFVKKIKEQKLNSLPILLPQRGDSYTYTKEKQK